MMKGLSRKIICMCIGLCAVAVITPWVADAQDDLQAASEVIRHQKRIYMEKEKTYPKKPKRNSEKC